MFRSVQKNIPARSVRTSLAASTLAGLSVLGVSEDKREMTLISYDARWLASVIGNFEDIRTMVSTV